MRFFYLVKCLQMVPSAIVIALLIGKTRLCGVLRAEDEAPLSPPRRSSAVPLPPITDNQNRSFSHAVPSSFPGTMLAGGSSLPSTVVTTSVSTPTTIFIQASTLVIGGTSVSTSSAWSAQASSSSSAPTSISTQTTMSAQSNVIQQIAGTSAAPTDASLENSSTQMTVQSLPTPHIVADKIGTEEDERWFLPNKVVDLVTLSCYDVTWGDLFCLRIWMDERRRTPCEAMSFYLAPSFVLLGDIFFTLVTIFCLKSGHESLSKVLFCDFLHFVFWMIAAALLLFRYEKWNFIWGHLLVDASDRFKPEPPVEWTIALWMLFCGMLWYGFEGFYVRKLYYDIELVLHVDPETESTMQSVEFHDPLASFAGDGTSAISAAASSIAGTTTTGWNPVSGTVYSQSLQVSSAGGPQQGGWQGGPQLPPQSGPQNPQQGPWQGGGPPRPAASGAPTVGIVGPPRALPPV